MNFCSPCGASLSRRHLAGLQPCSSTGFVSAVRKAVQTKYQTNKQTNRQINEQTFSFGRLLKMSERGRIEWSLAESGRARARKRPLYLVRSNQRVDRDQLEALLRPFRCNIPPQVTPCSCSCRPTKLARSQSNALTNARELQGGRSAIACAHQWADSQRASSPRRAKAKDLYQRPSTRRVEARF